MNKRNPYRFAWLVLLVLLYFSAFWKLDSWPIIQWDESRFAINAFEMAENGKILTPYYEGEPDFWNSKPPLTAFSQAFWMRVRGAKELAVRLPSAIAAVCTVFLLLFFLRTITESKLSAMLAAFALLACPGYWGIHIARTGDADALLVWWQMVYLLALFGYLFSGRRRYLWFFAIGLLLAGMTKGVAAYLPLPAAGVFLLLSREGSNALRDYRLYLAGGSALALFALYYLLREYLTPGYIDTVAFNEWGGRLLREEGSGQAVSRNWGYYFQNLSSHRLFPLVYCLPVAAILALVAEKRITRLLTLYVLLLTGGLLFILSFSQTKHPWYDAPLYPLFAIIIGVGSCAFFERLKRSVGRAGATIVSLLIGLSLFVYPYFRILQQNNGFDKIQPYEAEGLILKDIDRYISDTDSLWVVKPVSHVFHWDQILFYQKAWEKRGGPFIRPVQKVTTLKPGYYLSGDPEVSGKIRSQQGVEMVTRRKNCELLRVNP